MEEPGVVRERVLEPEREPKRVPKTTLERE